MDTYFSNNIKAIYKEHKNMIIKCLCCLLAIITVTATGMNFQSAQEVLDKNFVHAVLYSFQGWGIGNLLYVICITCIYAFVFDNYHFRKDIAKFSIFLSSLMLIGMCYKNAVGLTLIVQSVAQIIKSGIVIIGYSTMFYCAILMLLLWLRKLILSRSYRNTETNSEEGGYYKVKVAVFLLICWMPYLLVYYPGAPTYDVTAMLNQFFGYNQLTNANPLLQTLLIGTFVQIGHYFGSAAAGLFLYILIQVCAFILVLAYMADLLRNIGISQKIIRVFICIYAFVPIFPLYAVSIGKDINFAIAVLLLSIFLFEVSIDPEVFVYSTPKMVLLAVVLLLICLFRNEGILFLICTFPCFVCLAKKYCIAFCSIFAGVLVLVALWFKCLLPFLGIPNGSISEPLSIPFIQTARCVYYYGSEMTEEEIDAIDKILQFDTLAERYSPEISDDVKRKYNNNATAEEWSKYLKVYFHQFLEHPITYVDAVLNKSYGYLYPDDKGKSKPYLATNIKFPELDEHNFKFRPEILSGILGAMRPIWEAFRNIPLLGCTTSIGFYFWCIFLDMFFVSRSKTRRLLAVFTPAMGSLIVCVASPVNAYFRYGLLVVFAAPFYAALVFYSARGHLNNVVQSNIKEETFCRGCHR